jgi:hypothetical protein
MIAPIPPSADPRPASVVEVRRDGPDLLVVWTREPGQDEFIRFIALDPRCNGIAGQIRHVWPQARREASG